MNIKSKFNINNFMINYKIIKKIQFYSKIYKPENVLEYDKACDNVYIFAEAYDIKVKKKFYKYAKNHKLQCINVWSKYIGILSNKSNNFESDMHLLFIAPNNLGFIKYIDSNYSKKIFLDTNKSFDDDAFDAMYNDCYNKGIIARAIFYIITVYHKEFLFNKFFWNNIDKLKTWNKLYPPDKFEIIRNYKIKKIQGNVNPYIVNPFIVNRIFIV